MSNFSVALLVSALASFFAFGNETPENENGKLVGDLQVSEVCIPTPPSAFTVDGDTTKGDTIKNPNDRIGDPTTQPYVSPMYLENPGNLEIRYELAEDGSGYYIYEQIGGVDVRPPSYISFEDYLEYRKNNGVSDYFRRQSLLSNEETRPGLIPTFDLGQVGDIFGGGTVEIRPNGSASLNFSYDVNKTENPALPVRQQRVGNFNFDQTIQLNVTGQIGEAMKINTNWDTKATFDFENELKLKYKGNEDQIIQTLEAGNVSMTLGNSLIQGRQNLFGIKAGLKFGPVLVTSIASMERGKVETVTAKGGGAVETPFTKQASDYDANRHFFLTHNFRSRYDNALQNLPLINSPFIINQVEVWVTNQGNNSTTNLRAGLGFVDLGENPASGGLLYNNNIVPGPENNPDNDANDLFALLQSNPDFRDRVEAVDLLTDGPKMMANGIDFEQALNLRKLEENRDFTLQPQLGFISLNSPLQSDQVLFVSFSYALSNGESYQVGEFSNDVPANGQNSNQLFLKMLKPINFLPERGGKAYPAWNLMMKNIYNIGGYGLSAEGFFLDIMYESGTSDGKINFLPDGAVKDVPLMQVMRIDRLTNNTAPQPDNYFDFIPGLTVVPDRGLIIFPVLEPFGTHLADRLQNNPNDSARFVFQDLYTKTKADAQQNKALDRYSLEGYYRGTSSSEIPLNTFNLSQGSITVTANGLPLIEGVDYDVDYFGGKVIIKNPAYLSSGQDIQVSYESSSLYNVQSKTLVGTRAEVNLNDDIGFGATIMTLTERPFNNKIQLGDEPLKNTLWGFDTRIRTESEWMTKMIDKLPLLSTKETSNINFSGEVAQFLPSLPRALKNDQTNENGIIYLDDFEGAITPFNLQGVQRWKLASLPQYTDSRNLYNPTGDYPGQPLSTNYTRAKLSWYQIDQSFYQGFAGIDFPEEDLSNNYTRRISPNELFPTATRPFGATIQTTFDLHYQPSERGPYNYQTDPARLRPNGRFRNPEENWAGITSDIGLNTDFEASNVEYLEFWLMDPYLDSLTHEGGQMYINLGSVSEDVLPDKLPSFEHGLPTSAADTNNVVNTDWGRIPNSIPPTNAFANSAESRKYQDVGLDGLNDSLENVFYAQFLNDLAQVVNPGSQPFQKTMQDPSTDDFRHFRDDSFEATKSGILERYQDFNGVEGNSPLGGNPAPGGFTRQATQNPDTEDINRNGTPNTAEEYWEYKIDLKRSSMIPGQNYIVDRVDTVVNAGPNASQQVPVTWFQFRIPLASGTARNNIPNFKAINFMRMYLTGFKQDVILRMTEFQLVSSQWRRFTGNLQELAQDTMPDEPPFATFQVGSVSLEENSTKEPFNYMLPPGIVQQNLNGNTQVGFLQNERSLTMQMCGLEDGDARGIFRVVNYDLRNYQKLKMWIHAEARTDGIQPPNFDQVGDASAFIRLGLDNDLNYYEYEIPLTPSDISLGGNNVNNVWPAGNQMDFELALLGVAKGLRNQDQYPLNDRYKFTQGLPPGHAIYVKGTPKTSDIRTIMIGIRNPKDSLGIDIDPICLEAWVNELRLTDYDNASGWAANANLSVKLADFGNITASASRRTFGFGALDQQLSERVRESIFRYNIAANLALGKLFPQKWGIQLPVYLTYGEQMLTPQFDPREADVLTEKLLEQLSPEEKTEALKKIQDFQRTQSISFNNVKKNKTNPDSKSHPWDFSNLDFTFSYNELLARSANVERRFTTRHSAAINYRYNFKPVSFQPFKNWKRRNPISLFNISPVPSSVSVSVAGDRSFQENRIRPSPTFGGNIMPTYQKNFLITRNYALAWNLTQNLNLNFTATNVARVDEVHGYWDEATQEERDSVGPIWRNILSFGRDSLYGNNQLINFGRTIGYNHNITASYQLPFSQYSWTDWLSGNINYTASFMWSQAPEITPSIGNVITNSQNIQASGRVDLKGLYRKVGLLKLMDKLKVKKGDQPKKPGEKETKGKKDQDDNKPGLEEPGKKDDKTKKEEEEESDPFYFLKVITSEVLRVIFSIQSVDLTYGQNNSTLLPGFLPQTDNFGLDFRYTDTATMMASPVIPPTVGFILGSQRDIRGVAGENGWITRDTTLSNYFATNYSEQFTARTSVELFKGFRVDINVNRNLTENYSELFRWDDFMQDYNSFNRQVNGTFTMSYIMGLSTLFEKSLDSENRVLPSSSFQEFDQYRILISQRLDQLNPNSVDLGYRGRLSDGYYNGYTRTHQEVLVSAFLSAYGPVKPEKIQLSAFPKIPLPNWSVNYNGLTQIPALKKIFTNVSLRHTYRGTYTVGSYNLNLEARVTGVDQDFSGETRALGTDTLSSGFVVDKVNFQPVRNITIVQMSEQFSPLIGVNMNFKNGMTASIDYKTGRQISLSIGNLQLTESNNKDLSVMFGLRKDNLNLVVNLFGKVLDLKNSANFQFRLSMRDTREINRTLDSFQDPIITRGNYSFSLNPSIDYVVNNRLNLRLFFEQNINRPYTSNSFNTSFSSGGLQLRFMLN